MIDLAWLLMSHPSARPPEVLEQLLASVQEYAEEYLPAMLVHARDLMRRGEADAAKAELQRALREARDAPVPWVHQVYAAALTASPWPEPKGLLCQTLWD
ncbi:MAG: hypothetical protein C4K60_16140 [Ideonella sp. MAG2]|nr:MAG: hypothetical protein C4K60_16140 [Ideonella sp. MAG2]